jgi:membrane protein DedA with SNARE-associated domain
VEELLERYGLLAVFAGAYLEGDVTVILSGVVSHVGLLHYAAAVAVAFAGGVLRDLTCYWLGRSSSRARGSRAYRRAAVAVERLAGRFGPLEIIAAPFIYGARTASMIFWGVRDLPAARFVALDAVGCAAWVLAFSGLGYLVSNRAEALIGEVKQVEKWLLAALAAAVVFVLLRRALSPRRA